MTIALLPRRQHALDSRWRICSSKTYRKRLLNTPRSGISACAQRKNQSPPGGRAELSTIHGRSGFPREFWDILPGDARDRL